MNTNIAMLTCFSFVITIATLASQTESQGPPKKDCELLTQCSCSMSDGSGDIDLTSLSGSNGEPRFINVLNKEEDNLYSYSPCGSFDFLLNCKDATACLNRHTQSVQIGDYGRADFEYDGNNVVVSYSSGSGVLKLTRVNLICDPTACDPIFVPNGQKGPGQYEMTLTTICACPGKCSASGPTSGCHSSHPSKGGTGGSIGVGTILVIIFFVTLLMYLTAGIAYTRIRKQATGSDMIPNKEFWVVLPSLVVTGGKFVVAKIRRKEANYNQI